jgi:hypothetical protein
VNLFQEEHVVNYLIMLRDAFWPKTTRVERPTRTEEEKIERRQQAKRQLLTNIPGLAKTIFFFLFNDLSLETVSLIFGSDNARLGAERLFELFQDIQLNKHLFYVRIIFLKSLN